MGLYFAQISSEGVCEAVESADAYIFVGPTFNDYSTCAFSHLLSESKMVRIDARRVTVAGKQTFGCVNMAEFLPELAKELKPNDTTWQAFQRTYVGPGKVPSNGKDQPLKGKILYSHLQVSPSLYCGLSCMLPCRRVFCPCAVTHPSHKAIASCFASECFYVSAAAGLLNMAALHACEHATTSAPDWSRLMCMQRNICSLTGSVCCRIGYMMT